MRDQHQEAEIQVRGASVFHGYLNMDDKTDEAFTSDGWFRTGDLGYFNHGNLRITGRISSMIKTEGGKKVQPDHLEDAYAKDPAIKEIGVLDSHGKLAALIVPDIKVIGSKDLQKSIADSLKKSSTSLPSYYRLNEFAISKEPLPRTNLGKIRRQELAERYEKAKNETSDSGKNGAKHSDSDLSADDRAVLEDPVSKQCWDWLKERFPDADITFDTSPQLDLNVDSLEWLNLTLELRERLSVDLSEDAIARIETVRDLLHEVADASQLGDDAASPFQEPEKVLDDNQKKWLTPLNPVMQVLSYCLYVFNFILMKVFFRVSTEGLENIPKHHVIICPNHASYLDAFALSAALNYRTLTHTQIASWAGIALANPFNSFIYRLAFAIPIEAKKSLISSLALGAAVIKAKRNLIWFPEGERTLDGKLLRFKPGIGMLLKEFSVDVVPVYLEGTRKALPPGAFFPDSQR